MVRYVPQAADAQSVTYTKGNMNQWEHAIKTGPRLPRPAGRPKDLGLRLTLGVDLSRMPGGSDALASLLSVLRNCGWERSRLSWEADADSLSRARVTVVLSASRSSRTASLLRSTQGTLRRWPCSSGTFTLLSATVEGRKPGEPEIAL